MSWGWGLSRKDLAAVAHKLTSERFEAEVKSKFDKSSLRARAPAARHFAVRHFLFNRLQPKNGGQQNTQALG
jgi:hypothetical protein